MYFYMPTKIYCESNCVRNHAKDLSTLGKKALIVTGRRSSKENGSLADIQDTLSKEGISYEIFDRIEENPSIETVMEARDFGNESGAEKLNSRCFPFGGHSFAAGSPKISLEVHSKGFSQLSLIVYPSNTKVLLFWVPPT